MIQIGRFRFGFTAFSTIIVFIVLSACAISAAIRQARPEVPVPLSLSIITNESLALLATLVYGIFAHFATAIINRLKTGK